MPAKNTPASLPDFSSFPEIEIFRAGRHTTVDGRAVTVTPADLTAIANAYDPAVGEAPHVIGHPALNAPAFGWVKKLTARDGALFASSDQIDPAFADIVNQGRYKKRSAAFFMPSSPSNPKPGAMYLRHVGWLGAAAPAVAGLRDVQFAGDPSDILEFGVTLKPWTLRNIAEMLGRIRDLFIERDGIDKTDAILPKYQIDSIANGADVEDDDAAPAASFSAQETPPMSDPTHTAEFAARESALATREAQLAQREQALRAQETAAQRAGIAEFAASLVKAGRLLPRQQAPVVELIATLEAAAEPATLHFAAADGTPTSATAGATLRALLGELPVRVPMGEISAGAADEAAGIEFAAPRGDAVSREGLELLAKVQAYQRANPSATYIDAVRACGG
jgi:hypothetical protein